MNTIVTDMRVSILRPDKISNEDWKLILEKINWLAERVIEENFLVVQADINILSDKPKELLKTSMPVTAVPYKIDIIYINKDPDDIVVIKGVEEKTK